MGYIALDRVRRGSFKPPYCVHGYTWCVNCKHQVYLGLRTYDAVAKDGHLPVCMVCARLYATETPTGGLYEDHQSKDGPHD